ncbi:MAG: nuclease-related domain-containing protein [Candidatus Bathyarchaeota archaeon]
MHARAHLIFLILNMVFFVDLFLAGISGIPYVSTFGLSEFGRGTWFMFFGIMGLISWTRYTNYSKGLRGEEQVSDYLKSRLSEEYFLINDVTLPGGYGNIDHIILSRNMVFVLETKNNGGRVKFYGANWNLGRRSPVTQVYQNAAALNSIIKDSRILTRPRVPFIEGLVVFLKAEITKSDPETPVYTLTDLPERIHGLAGDTEQYSCEELDKINKYIMTIAEKIESEENRFVRIIWRDFRGLLNL